jgi:hypothetical protein
MMKKKLVLMTVLMVALSFALMACVTAPVKPTDKNFVAPKVTLASFEVPQYDGYWYYAKAVTPTKGDADDRGAMLPMSFLFNVENPNSYPILLNGITFTVKFDNEFALVTYTNNDQYWIPANKTDQIRATTLITARSALLSLMVTGGFKLKAKGIGPFDALEKWWKGVPEGTTPVHITECSFSFQADGVNKTYPYEIQAQ